MTELDLRALPNVLPILDLRRSLADTVHVVLRDAITDGSLRPGERLREVRIADHFNISPTPVREALRRLERDGLVDANAHRGASVASVAPHELANLYEIHEILESQASRQAAETPGRDLTACRALLDRIEPELDNPSQLAFNRLDLQFHHALNVVGGNRHLADLIEGIHRRIQSARVQFEIHLPDRPRQSQIQHRALLAAVEGGDADAAEQIARTHIKSVREPVIAMLRATTGSPETK